MAAIQWSTVPFASVTSKRIWLWGLVHSNFVIVPFIFDRLAVVVDIGGPVVRERRAADQPEKDGRTQNREQVAFDVVLHVMPPKKSIPLI